MTSCWMPWKQQKNTDQQVICHVEKILRTQIHLLKISASFIESFIFNADCSCFNSIIPFHKHHWMHFPSSLLRYIRDVISALWQTEAEGSIFPKTAGCIWAGTPYFFVRHWSAWQSHLSACRHKTEILETPQFLIFISKSGYLQMEMILPNESPAFIRGFLYHHLWPWCWGLPCVWDIFSIPKCHGIRDFSRNTILSLL